MTARSDLEEIVDTGHPGLLDICDSKDAIVRDLFL